MRTFKVGDKVQMNCTDQTGQNGPHEVVIRSLTVSGGVEYAHMDRPRGNPDLPAIHAPRMNTYVAALALSNR